jgi:hypothetical protein
MIGYHVGEPLVTEIKKLPALCIPRNEATRLLEDRIEKARELQEISMRSMEDYHRAQTSRQSWMSHLSAVLLRIFESPEMVNDLFATVGGGVSVPRSINDLAESFRAQVGRDIQRVEGLLERLPLYPDMRAPVAESGIVSSNSNRADIERICRRFHQVVRELGSRHAGRAPFTVNDEYDVQDLLHALLRLYFDDIRPEEWTPSYAGGSSRMDFFLPEERTVIEVKKSRLGLGARELGDQLLIDIGRYQSYQNCSRLVCFVYDPDGRIHNPRGVEADLAKSSTKMDVVLLIQP